MARATQASFTGILVVRQFNPSPSPIFKYRVIQRVIHQGHSQGDQGVIHA